MSYLKTHNEKMIPNGVINSDSLGNYTKPESGIPKSDLSEEVQETLNSVEQKQETLVSGENIKTINNESILGEGNIAITAQTYVIDNTPAADSDNLVKSGGVAREIVWDVTARNSNATFASLSALLSDANLATLIPTTIRRGGMQIRFVLSSDNNYVQYLYKKTDAATAATFTNVANWEKVNLEDEVERLDAKVNGANIKITQADVTSEAGAWKDNNGVIGKSSSGVLHRAEAIDLTKYTIFSLTTNLSWSTANAAYLCDISGNIIETITTSSLITKDKEVPEGATKLYINYATAFTFEGTATSIEEKINTALEEYQEDYCAREIVDNTIPMQLVEDDFELGNLDANGNEISATSVIRSGYIEIISGSGYTQSTSNDYRANIYVYDAQKAYIGGYSWHTGTYQNTFNANGAFIRIVIASPSGVSTEPNWDDAAFSLIIAKAYKYVRAQAENTINEVIENYFNIELPILAPSPQLPANAETISDINAETMTSESIQNAIETIIGKLPIPDKYSLPNNPKYGTLYGTIGKDSSGQYDIKAYIFTKRNRLCWRNAAALYAWVNGTTTYYTDHRSPIVGDVVYSNASRADSGYTVTSYNSSVPAITVNGTAYTRDDSKKVDADEIYSGREIIVGTTQIYVYNKNGIAIGYATVSSATTITFSGKTYTRYSSRDFHTDNKATIVLWGNEHGPQSDPNEPSIILYRLVKDLCDGGVNNPFISFLRGYCKIVIIPAANPWGVNRFASSGQPGRNNANNVNINRNYDTIGWSVQTDSDKGSYAGDQPETQFIMNTVLDIEADLAIDIHCLGYVTEANDGRSHYEGAVSALNTKVESVIKDYCGLSYSSYGSENPNERATGADWIYSLGIAGGLIEMNAGAYATSYDGKQHSNVIMFADYTLLLNTIRMWYYTFDSTLDLTRMSIK